MALRAKLTVLADALATAAGVDGDRWEAAERAAIVAELADQLESARAYWNGLDIAPAAVAAYVGARLDCGNPESAVSVLAALDSLAVGDLYLACGCAARDDRALAEFETAFATEIKRATRRLDSSGDLGDEILQVLRDKLFVVEPGATPGIERYLGRGPLGRWLWVMATREALMWHRRRRRETPLVDGHLGIADGDIELDYLKREYRTAFRLAFSEAIVKLDSKQRNLLYYHFVRRLTMDQIGSIYRVHRVTVFRWLRRARTALVSATRDQLAARLDVSGTEVDSIMRLVDSRLEASVERVLSQGQISE